MIAAVDEFTLPDFKGWPWGIWCRDVSWSVSVFQVGGLASENVRWAEAVENFRKQERTLCGDVLLITAFISYLGYFTKRYRLQLMDNTWRPYLSQLKVGGLVLVRWRVTMSATELTSIAALPQKSNYMLQLHRLQQCGDLKNSDWSAWAARVFSYKFMILKTKFKVTTHTI